MVYSNSWQVGWDHCKGIHKECIFTLWWFEENPFWQWYWVQKTSFSAKLQKTWMWSTRYILSPYHPPSNGRIEGFHSFLKACLSKHVSNALEWDGIVTFVCAVYNFLPNEHSREAPFFPMFGRDPRIPLNEFLRPRLRYLGKDETIMSTGIS